MKKEKRAREGAEAMLQYKADVCAVREKTARLRALRLAKEAGDNVAKLNKKPISSKTTQKTSRVRKKHKSPFQPLVHPAFQPLKCRSTFQIPLAPATATDTKPWLNQATKVSPTFQNPCRGFKLRERWPDRPQQCKSRKILQIQLSRLDSSSEKVAQPH